MGIADEVVLVLMPGSGDSVQALKAGIMEIPDVIAVNKMDQPGAKAMVNDIRGVIALDPESRQRPPIVLTEAVRGEGVEQLWSALVERRDALAAAPGSSRRRGAKSRRRSRRRRDGAGEGPHRGGDRERPGARRADRSGAAARGRPADGRRPDRRRRLREGAS